MVAKKSLRWKTFHPIFLVDEMQYRCTLKPLTTFAGNPSNFCTMCDKCGTLDCDNPIEFVSISILGKTSKHRIYKTISGSHQVVQCDGFSLNDESDTDEDE